MSIERVNPPSLAAPSGFAHAVDRDRRAAGLPGRARRRWTQSGAIVGETVVEQFELALANLLTALEAAGGQPTHLASLTVYAVDLADYRAQRPGDRRGLAAAGGPGLPGDGGDRRVQAVGRRCARRGARVRGHPGRGLNRPSLTTRPARPLDHPARLLEVVRRFLPPQQHDGAEPQQPAEAHEDHREARPADREHQVDGVQAEQDSSPRSGPSSGRGRSPRPSRPTGPHRSAGRTRRWRWSRSRPSGSGPR